jgi:hypothetical protein
MFSWSCDFLKKRRSNFYANAMSVRYQDISDMSFFHIDIIEFKQLQRAIERDKFW